MWSTSSSSSSSSSSSQFDLLAPLHQLLNTIPLVKINKKQQSDIDTNLIIKCLDNCCKKIYPQIKISRRTKPASQTGKSLVTAHAQKIINAMNSLLAEAGPHSENLKGRILEAISDKIEQFKDKDFLARLRITESHSSTIQTKSKKRKSSDVSVQATAQAVIGEKAKVSKSKVPKLSECTTSSTWQDELDLKRRLGIPEDVELTMEQILNLTSSEELILSGCISYHTAILLSQPHIANLKILMETNVWPDDKYVPQTTKVCFISKQLACFSSALVVGLVLSAYIPFRKAFNLSPENIAILEQNQDLVMSFFEKLKRPVTDLDQVNFNAKNIKRLSSSITLHMAGQAPLKEIIEMPNQQFQELTSRLFEKGFKYLFDGTPSSFSAQDILSLPEPTVEIAQQSLLLDLIGQLEDIKHLTDLNEEQLISLCTSDVDWKNLLSTKAPKGDEYDYKYFLYRSLKDGLLSLKQFVGMTQADIQILDSLLKNYPIRKLFELGFIVPGKKNPFIHAAFNNLKEFVKTPAIMRLDSFTVLNLIENKCATISFILSISDEAFNKLENLHLRKDLSKIKSATEFEYFFSNVSHSNSKF